MIDHGQPYANGPSAYNHNHNGDATPILSPTDSIAFSETLHMSQPFEISQYGVYSNQNIIPAQSRPEDWYTEYSSNRASSTNSVLQNTHQLVYGHGPSLAVTVANTAVNFAHTPHLTEPLMHWSAPAHQPSSTTHPPQISSWHQSSQGHFSGVGQSRQNSIASTSVATTLSPAATNVDDPADNLRPNALHTMQNSLPQHQQQRSHDLYHGTRVAMGQVTSPRTAQMLTNGNKSDVPSPVSPSLASHSSSSQFQSVSPKDSQNLLAVLSDSNEAHKSLELPVKRKRGRPRLIRGPEDTKRSRPDKTSRRQPHNEIERKYREGLNVEMEKLRHAIPRLPQLASGAGSKPSKAAVLKIAVEEIESLRAEKAKALAEKEKAELDLKRAMKTIQRLEQQTVA